MADRYPLIYNPSANQIQELQAGDSLDVGSAGIKNVSELSVTGVITASSFDGTIIGSVGSATTASFATTSFALSGDPVVRVSGISTATGTSSQFLKADGSVDSSTYITAIGIQSGGSSIGNATTLNFIGAGNTFSVNGSTIDISIQGSGGSSGGGSAAAASLDITSCLFI